MSAHLCIHDDYLDQTHECSCEFDTNHLENGYNAYRSTLAPTEHAPSDLDELRGAWSDYGRGARDVIRAQWPRIGKVIDRLTGWE